MTKSPITSYILIFLIGWFFGSCEQKVDLFQESKFIPVIYCLLNPQDSVQVVRVSRVFQNTDQYSKWEEEYDRYLRDTIVRIYIEDIDSEGFRNIHSCTLIDEKLGEDNFSLTFTRLYQCCLKPEQKAEYQLYAYFPEVQTMASAKIRVLSPVNLIDPAIVPGRKIVIDPTQPYTIRWMGSKGAAYYQGILKINYLEKKNDEIMWKTTQMVLDPVLKYPEEAVFSQSISGVHLLNTLRDSIPVLDSVTRKVENFDFTFIYGGEELALFTNSGINPLGLTDRVSDYSNLDNARGVFSSISRIEVFGIPLCEQSADTIALNKITKELGFIKSDEEF